jgi:lipopolysaccharide transport system permease protein
MGSALSIPGALRALWRYRSFIAGNVERDFRLRYTGSVLGVAWNLLEPLALVLVYVVVFAEVMHARLPGGRDAYDYALYVLAGMLVWLCFSEIVGRCVNLFIDNANLLKKAAFPRVTLVASAIASSLVNLGLMMLVFGAVLVVIGRFPGWIALILFAPVAITIVLASGLGILLGTLNVLFRDVAHATAIFLQFWFWLTPIVYPASVLPDRFRAVAAWNPLTPLVSAFQTVIVSADTPDWRALGATLVVALVAFAVGYALFKGNAATLVDEL